jgi:nudix-type nucleoside diphosphatase (YffH/AdpP family)
MMNPNIDILKTEILANDWYTLNKVTFRQQDQQGCWTTQSREAYDRGNGAAILLYNPQQHTIVVTRQFRLPTYINGNADGMLIEVCAGLLDGEQPEAAIKREVEEETGYCLNAVTKVFEMYMSPGSVTEILHFFTAIYSAKDKTSRGGGTGADEQIEVLEMHIDEAMLMVKKGLIKDAKTIILLQHLILSGQLNTG